MWFYERMSVSLRWLEIEQKRQDLRLSEMTVNKATLEVFFGVMVATCGWLSEIGLKI